MDAASTRLAVLSLQAQGAAGDMDIAEIDVITTMERYCMMGQNNRILAHFEGKGETPGVVKDISSIEGKLPTILPRLVPSNVVEDGGKAFLRSIAQQAFLCVSVPAYDASNHYISDTALAYAKHKPEELGTNGKHLLSPTNKKGKQNVLVIIQEKINSMRFDIRKLVHESIEAEKNLKELVEDVQASCPEMEVTWEFTEYVALWRRTGVTNGYKKEGGDWNNKFWTQHDERLHNYLENCKAGDAGDEEKRKEAEDYIYDVIVHDEEQFGECPRPERRATCDVQTLFSNIFANGIASNV
ncbi:unnamed protein product [Tilletia controversa]|nr:unnamed protein product [Tilletia controversa]